MALRPEQDEALHSENILAPLQSHVDPYYLLLSLPLSSDTLGILVADGGVVQGATTGPEVTLTFFLFLTAKRGRSKTYTRLYNTEASHKRVNTSRGESTTHHSSCCLDLTGLTDSILSLCNSNSRKVGSYYQQRVSFA